MLTATPRNWLSWNYTVLREDRPLADIDMSWWREKGTLEVDGSVYAVYREAPLSGRFLLERDGSLLASAEKPSALRRRMLIEHAGRQYELRPRDLFTRTFELREGAEVIGRLSAQGIFTRKMNVDLPESLPLPVRVFVTWLTVMLWKRDAAAVGASGGA